MSRKPLSRIDIIRNNAAIAIAELKQCGQLPARHSTRKRTVNRRLLFDQVYSDLNVFFMHIELWILFASEKWAAVKNEVNT